MQSSAPSDTFSPYQKFIIVTIAVLQFTVILDFMVLSPLSALLLKELQVTTTQFGLVVSAYAFSAFASGIAAAGFADKFDRKRLLLFFYVGFLIGTLMCGLAPDYYSLLVARIVTGLFGGVLGSIGGAIVTDLFPMSARGRVMGVVQMAFAVSQVFGIPVGLLLANQFGWHAPFLMIVGFSSVVGVVIFTFMRPVRDHLHLNLGRHPMLHLWKTVTQWPYIKAFLATTLMTTGGFMLMPFGAAFSVHNLGITNDQLPILYAITGVFSMIFGPIIGRLSDRVGKYPVFAAGSLLTMIMVAIYTQRGITPFWFVIVLNVLLFAGISSRMISSMALMSAVPEPHDRGAFMSINSSVQQLSGGVASAIAGTIVMQTRSGLIEHYDVLGYVVIVAIAITIAMMYWINLQIADKQAAHAR